MDRYVVVAKVHCRVSNGESHHDGSPLWLSYFEDRSYTFTGDQSIGTIFERLSRIEGDVVDIKLLYDGSSYDIPESGKDPAY
ncbi:hypothetical protein [Mesorhizobium sp. M2C.T.Ca.TU.002.02.1.1]|uniref:hypothetical protein n=1 Tax=Mesorhizobium sp. M2C.T.Ca.TU.002.02.1.1 TaxID=2496788 RepID=UPI000FCC524A|nr:hypothetical protein [Mesorhizobium sp. M2C.T.Ca.TU.002.02.1.1]RUU59445.1 hypothetical protein EOD07_07065 [Mesorhizobium sp. M2C.T.Ca.TU.002.02.1.1]RUU71591.1 hypothetical protein EOD04_02200 [Mesorhizobium sp. M2C.T.Ca.TU.009.01.2.1]